MLAYASYPYMSIFLQVAMRALGFEVKKAEVLKVLRDYDRDGSGKMLYDDFVTVSELKE